MSFKVAKIYPPIVSIFQRSNNYGFILHCPMQSHIELYNQKHNLQNIICSPKSLKQIINFEDHIYCVSENSLSLVNIQLNNIVAEIKLQNDLMSKSAFINSNSMIKFDRKGSLYLSTIQGSQMAVERLSLKINPHIKLRNENEIGLQYHNNKITYQSIQLNLRRVCLQQGIPEDIVLHPLISKNLNNFIHIDQNTLLAYTHSLISLLDCRINKQVLMADLQQINYLQKSIGPSYQIDYSSQNNIWTQDLRFVGQSILKKNIQLNHQPNLQISWFNVVGSKEWDSQCGHLMILRKDRPLFHSIALELLM